jgi:hypothetical protein
MFSFDETISSVSKRWNPVCFSRIRPTEDFPVPMNPISTMDLAELTRQYAVEDRQWKDRF